MFSELSSFKIIYFKPEEKVVVKLFVLNIDSEFLNLRILDQTLKSLILLESFCIPNSKADFFLDNLQFSLTVPSSHVFILFSKPSSPNCQIILGPGTVRKSAPAAFILSRAVSKFFIS